MESPFGADCWDWSRTWGSNHPHVSLCQRTWITRLLPVLLLMPAVIQEILCLMTQSVKQNSVKTMSTVSGARLSRIILSIMISGVRGAELCIIIAFTVLSGGELDIFAVTAILAQMTSMLLVFCIVRKSHVSGLVWTFVLVHAIACILDAVLVSSGKTGQYGEVDALFILMTAPLSIALLISCSFECRITPEEVAHSCRHWSSFPSRITFTWINRIVWKGRKSVLDLPDLSALVPETSARSLSADLWLRLFPDKNSNTGKRGGGKANLTWSLVQSFKGDAFRSGLFKLMIDAGEFTKPLILKWLLSSLKSHNEVYWHRYVISTIMLIAVVACNISQHMYQDAALLFGIRMRTALRACIYRKSLKISAAARGEKSVGEIVNLMAVDTEKVRAVTEFLHSGWCSWITIAVALLLLYMEVGVSAFAGFSVICGILMISILISYRIEANQRRQMMEKDQRICLMSEMLSSMKILKLYAWEEAFISMIDKIREREVKFLRRCSMMAWIRHGFFMSTANFVTMTMFILYLALDDDHFLTPSLVFVSLSYVYIIRIALGDLPKFYNALSAARVSLERLQDFFSAPETIPYISRHHHEDPPITSKKSVVTFQNASLSWSSKSEFRLQVTTEVAEGSLVAVVGSVGSGKSSFLSAILEEMCLNNGSVSLSSSINRIAYVPQQAWIVNATVRNNILFGSCDTHEVRYQQVLNVCELGSDLKLLQDGDETEIGEKGINLSGGQKQRVALARACYSDADLFLLDDPLSAVDAHVAQKLFHNVLSSKTGMLRGKTRILVTNNPFVLSMCDHIIILDDGIIVQSGSYRHMMQKGGLLSEYLTKFSSSTDSNESEKDAHEIQGKRSSFTVNMMQSLADDGEIMRSKEALIKDERLDSSKKEFNFFRDYVYLVWGYFALFTVLLTVYGVSSAVIKYWLSLWSNDYLLDDVGVLTRSHRITVYVMLTLTECASSIIAFQVLVAGAVAASIMLHDRLLRSVMRAPMSFFDTTPIGRILNRFSNDVESIDAALLDALLFLLPPISDIIGMVVVMLLLMPQLALVLIPLLIGFNLIHKYYIATARQLRRLESITTSLIFAQFAETLTGLSTITAFGSVDAYTELCNKRIDDHQSCTIITSDLNLWRSMRLEFLGNLVLFAAAIFASHSDSMDAGKTGLLLTYALLLPRNLNNIVRSACLVETEAISVDRLLHYATSIDQEADWKTCTPAPARWPDKGCIQFREFAARYRPGLNLSVRDLSLAIGNNEKVGIVGRTGAGKSTITLSLFRIIEAAAGSIVIDDVDISRIGLHDLRSRVTIIPQEPVIFSGSLRSNLDPFDEKTDEELWKCLQSAHLSSFLLRAGHDGLMMRISEAGANLSAGQRQLLCLARALLRKTKILVLDEATAAVDLETDQLIQETIRSEFADCTIVTIAHRINTILDSDRVLVLDAGRVVEFDTPSKLLQNKDSVFYSLAVDAGIVNEH